MGDKVGANLAHIYDDNEVNFGQLLVRGAAAKGRIISPRAVLIIDAELPAAVVVLISEAAETKLFSLTLLSSLICPFNQQHSLVSLGYLFQMLNR